MGDVRTYRNQIGGEPRPAAGGATLDSIDPATGELHARIPRSGGRRRDAAVAAARAALPEWSALPAAARARYLEQVGRGGHPVRHR